MNWSMLSFYGHKMICMRFVVVIPVAHIRLSAHCDVLSLGECTMKKMLLYQAV